jgi:hypothetical protein
MGVATGTQTVTEFCLWFVTFSLYLIKCISSTSAPHSFLNHHVIGGNPYIPAFNSVGQEMRGEESELNLRICYSLMIVNNKKASKLN